MVIDGFEPVELAPGWLAIPTPGHTRGHMCLLLDNRFLFTGDHLWWEPDTGQLGSPQQLVWNHDQLLRSIEKLLNYRFAWVLAGHGDRVHLDQDVLHAKLRDLLETRQTAARS